MSIFKKHTNTILILTACTVALVVLAFFPIRYPFTTIKPGPATSVPLYKDHAITTTLTVQANNLADVRFWVEKTSGTYPNLPLTLTVSDQSTGQLLSTVDTTWEKTYSLTYREIRFVFPTIRDTAHKKYVITLSAPSLDPDSGLSIRSPEKDNSTPVAIALSSSLPLISILTRVLPVSDLSGEDIYFYFIRGKQVLEGQNPYKCALDDTCLNRKNPGHFALFYWMSAWSQKLGLTEFEPWIRFWMPVFVIAAILTAGIVFTVLFRRKQPSLALFALLFILLNRWSLYSISVGQIDFLPILFLVISLLLFESKRKASLLCFSISLALKQMAIFLAPLYLAIIWRRTGSLKAVIISAVIMISIPFITSIPFLTNQPLAMASGLFFSVTRGNQSDFGAPAISRILQLHGASSIAFMSVLMGLIYIMAIQKKLPLSIASLAIFITFLAMNNVLFNQYFTWIAPLLPLALSDALLKVERKR